MEESANARNVVRFGVFEMDLEAGQLRKNGRRVFLQEKPFRVSLAAAEGGDSELPD